MKNILIFLSVSLLLFSCEKIIQIDIPDDGRRLVVNSFFASDSVLKVKLSKSLYILDSKQEFENVSNADISLFEEDNFVEKLMENNEGVYVGNYLLKSGKSYKLEIMADNFPSSTAESYIPERTEIEYFEAYNTRDEEGYEVVGFTIGFNDNINVENYYFIQIYERVEEQTVSYETGNDTVIVYYNKMGLYSNDPNAFNEDWYLEEGLLVNDELLNGKEYAIKCYSYGSYYYFYDEIGNPVEERKVSYYLNFYSVSKSYYLYYKTLSKHIEAQDEIFMEPVQVYTNVENGFGIFAGYSVDIDSTKVIY